MPVSSQEIKAFPEVTGKWPAANPMYPSAVVFPCLKRDAHHIYKTVTSIATSPQADS